MHVGKMSHNTVYALMMVLSTTAQGDADSGKTKQPSEFNDN